MNPAVLPVAECHDDRATRPSFLGRFASLGPNHCSEVPRQAAGLLLRGVHVSDCSPGQAPFA